MEYKATCLKEQKEILVVDAVLLTNKRGNPAVKGICPDCGTKVYRLLKKGG